MEMAMAMASLFAADLEVEYEVLRYRTVLGFNTLQYCLFLQRIPKWSG